ncbi:MAG TPA: hypothetical protein VMT50_06815 [Steroidobacteraceae bacterium]|nr:hypothetical protein [Steroidobacteraceae bacterium]
MPADTPPRAPAIAPAPRSWQRRLASFLLRTVLVALVLATLYTAFLLWWSYSDGERAGVVQKFSKRGWVCKTYEGELAMYVVGGVAPQIWDFSVRDAAIAQQLNKAVGQQVRAHYTQHVGLPTSCFGETEYFVDRVEVIAPPTPVQPSSGLSVSPAAPH